MAGKLRIGIIGCGKIADVCHLPGYKALPEVEIAALCDIRPDRLEAARQKYAPGAALFKDYRTLLKSGVKAVSICTPNDLHCPMAVDAFRAGLHVLCEKPMAGSTADASRMVVAARKARRILQINQSLHYMAPYVAVAEAIKAGRIGKPTHARCLRAHSGTPDKGWSPGAKWFVQRRHQGGVIFDIAIHMAEMMKWFVGEVDEVASCTMTRTPGIDVVDTVAAVFRFRNGATGVLELSWAMPFGGSLIEVYGTEGAIRMGFSGQTDLIRNTQGGRETTALQPPDSIKDSYPCFVDAVLGRAPSPTPGRLGWEAVAICEAIAEAGKRRAFVKVKKFRAGR